MEERVKVKCLRCGEAFEVDSQAWEEDGVHCARCDDGDPMRSILCRVGPSAVPTSGDLAALMDDIQAQWDASRSCEWCGVESVDGICERCSQLVEAASRVSMRGATKEAPPPPTGEELEGVVSALGAEAGGEWVGSLVEGGVVYDGDVPGVGPVAGVHLRGGLWWVALSRGMEGESVEARRERFIELCRELLRAGEG